MTSTAREFGVRLGRTVTVVVAGAAAGLLPLRRVYGVDGLEALAIASVAAALVVIVPTLLVRREPVPTAPSVLALTGLRMGLFLVAALSISFGVGPQVREPALIALAVLYLLSLAVETIAVVPSVARRPAAAEEPR